MAEIKRKWQPKNEGREIALISLHWCVNQMRYRHTHTQHLYTLCIIICAEMQSFLCCFLTHICRMTESQCCVYFLTSWSLRSHGQSEGHRTNQKTQGAIFTGYTGESQETEKKIYIFFCLLEKSPHSALHQTNRQVKCIGIINKAIADYRSAVVQPVHHTLAVSLNFGLKIKEFKTPYTHSYCIKTTERIRKKI